MVTASILRRALELQRLAAALHSKPDADVEDFFDAEAAQEAAAHLLRDFKAITTLRNKRRMRVGYGAMPHPRHSWWRHLLKLRGAEWDGAWIRFAGVSRELYDELVDVAAAHPDFCARPEDQKTAGRPMVIGSQDAIGLALRYMIGMCETVGLMSAFYASSECVNKALDHGTDLLLWALQRHPDAYVRWPSKEEQEAYNTVIEEHGDPLPEGLCSKRVFGWVDGFAVPITKPSDKEAERMWYAAKHQRCVASNVFAFTPQGTIMWFRVNVPGSVNDTDACRPLTAKILDEQRTIVHGVVMGDVAFKGDVSGANEAYLTPATTHKCAATTTVGDALTLGYWVLGKRQSVEVIAAFLYHHFLSPSSSSSFRCIPLFLPLLPLRPAAVGHRQLQAHLSPPGDRPVRRRGAPRARAAHRRAPAPAACAPRRAHAARHRVLDVEPRGQGRR